MRLYPKFLAVLIPCFVILAGIGLLLERQFFSANQTDDLAQRVGYLAGTVASSMQRNGAEQDAMLAQDLLAPLGHEPSVVCAEYRVREQYVASYPRGLGCRNAQFDESIDLALGPDTHLRVAITETTIQAHADAQFQQGMVTLGVAFVLTLLSSALGFHLIVSKRLSQLNRAIHNAVVHRNRLALHDESTDEIGILVQNYNRLVRVENDLEQALRRTNRQITEASQIDPLTGLYNRLYCQRHLEPLPTPSPGKAGFVAMIDIDHFKSINDTFGHDVGDQVLQILGARLRENMRDDSLAVRWGGEEFLVVFDQVDPEIGPKLANRLLDAIRLSPFVTDAGPLEVTASLGLCPVEVTDALDLRSVLNWADRALYLAKRSGRNRACLLWSDRDRNGDLLGQNLTGGDLTWIGTQETQKPGLELSA